MITPGGGVPIVTEEKCTQALLGVEGPRTCSTSRWPTVARGSAMMIVEDESKVPGNRPFHLIDDDKIVVVADRATLRLVYCFFRAKAIELAGGRLPARRRARRQAVIRTMHRSGDIERTPRALPCCGPSTPRQPRQSAGRGLRRPRWPTASPTGWPATSMSRRGRCRLTDPRAVWRTAGRADSAADRAGSRTADRAADHGPLFIVDNSDSGGTGSTTCASGRSSRAASTSPPATSRSARCSRSTASGRSSTRSGS